MHRGQLSRPCVFFRNVGRSTLGHGGGHVGCQLSFDQDRQNVLTQGVGDSMRQGHRPRREVRDA